MEDVAFVLVLKVTYRYWICSNRKRKEHGKMVVGQEVMYREDATQVKLKHRVCLGEVAERALNVKDTNMFTIVFCLARVTG